MIIDLHVHSTVSECSVMDIGEILGNARGAGLDGVCITDHESMRAAGMVRPGLQDDGLLVLIGVECHTPQGDVLVFGDFVEPPVGLDAPGLFRFARENNGAAVFAHPFRGRGRVDEAMLRGARPVVEVQNGRNSLAENRLAVDLARRHGLTACAGSDAHTLSELGTHPTHFLSPVTCMADLTSALRCGACEPAPARAEAV